MRNDFYRWESHDLQPTVRVHAPRLNGSTKAERDYNESRLELATTEQSRRLYNFKFTILLTTRLQQQIRILCCYQYICSADTKAVSRLSDVQTAVQGTRKPTISLQLLLRQQIGRLRLVRTKDEGATTKMADRLNANSLVVRIQGQKPALEVLSAAGSGIE